MRNRVLSLGECSNWYNNKTHTTIAFLSNCTFLNEGKEKAVIMWPKKGSFLSLFSYLFFSFIKPNNNNKSNSGSVWYIIYNCIILSSKVNCIYNNSNNNKCIEEKVHGQQQQKGKEQESFRYNRENTNDSQKMYVVTHLELEKTDNLLQNP